MPREESVDGRIKTIFIPCFLGETFMTHEAVYLKSRIQYRKYGIREWVVKGIRKANHKVCIFYVDFAKYIEFALVFMCCNISH